MKLPKYLNRQQQSFDFHRQVRSFTSCTVSIGDFFEEATALLLKGKRFTTENGCDYCPDVQLRKDRFAEVKACGRNGGVIVYQRRLEREMKWCEDNNISLDYVIWSHRCQTKLTTDEHDLYLALSQCVRAVLIVPVQTIFDLTKDVKPKTINRFNSMGYTRGWIVRRTKIAEKCSETNVRPRLRIYKHHYIKNLPILTQ